MLEAKLDAKIPLLSYKWVVEDVNMCTRQFPKMLTKFSNLVMLIVELPCVRLVIQWYFMSVSYTHLFRAVCKKLFDSV